MREMLQKSQLVILDVRISNSSFHYRLCHSNIPRRTPKRELPVLLKPDTRLPMMHVRDALRALSDFLEVPNSKLNRRVYNVTSMSFTPEELAGAMLKHLPELKISYQPDSRQDIGKDFFICT